ncbi:MAG TPA: hypothetical protein VFD70_23100 [Anaerolineae bacterium]|nr:hypothetical protein [Anaerolineae bacterium]
MWIERECSVDDLVSQLRQSVKDLLPNDEQVLMCYEKKYEASFRDKLRSIHDGWSAYIVTPKRLITIRYPYSLLSRLLEDIWAIREKRTKSESGELYVLVLEDTANENIFFTSKDGYDKFLGLLRQAMNQAKKVDIASKFDLPKSPVERLRALVQLHKDGLIDDSEFERIRKATLGQM